MTDKWSPKKVSQQTTHTSFVDNLLSLQVLRHWARKILQNPGPRLGLNSHHVCPGDSETSNREIPNYCVVFEHCGGEGGVGRGGKRPEHSLLICIKI